METIDHMGLMTYGHGKERVKSSVIIRGDKIIGRLQLRTTISACEASLQRPRPSDSDSVYKWGTYG